MKLEEEEKEEEKRRRKRGRKEMRIKMRSRYGCGEEVFLLLSREEDDETGMRRCAPRGRQGKRRREGEGRREVLFLVLAAWGGGVNRKNDNAKETHLLRWGWMAWVQQTTHERFIRP